MLNTLRKAILLFVLLLLIPSPAYAHIDFVFDLGGYAVLMFLIGLIAGFILLSFRMPEKMGMSITLGLAIIGNFLYFFITKVESFFVGKSSPTYRPSSTDLFGGILIKLLLGVFFGIIPLIGGFYAASSIVNSFRRFSKKEIIIFLLFVILIVLFLMLYF